MGDGAAHEWDIGQCWAILLSPSYSYTWTFTVTADGLVHHELCCNESWHCTMPVREWQPERSLKNNGSGSIKHCLGKTEAGSWGMTCPKDLSHSAYLPALFFM